MLKPLAVLLLCQLAGESAARALGLPVPGPVLGFLLLFVLLILRDRGMVPRLPSLGNEPGEPLGRVADGLLSVLGLLFVPAGVGVIDNLGLLAAHGVGLVVTLALSALLTLLATVGIFLAVASRGRTGEDAS